MSRHPEGGFFRRSFESSIKVQLQDQQALRPAFTHIYYFLPEGSYSRFHKNRYDEVWNLYSGEGIRIFLYNAQNHLVSDEELKPNVFRFHIVVPGGIWQAAEPIGKYALVGCTIAPGWEEQDEIYLFDNPYESKVLVELRSGWERLVHPV